MKYQEITLGLNDRCHSDRTSDKFRLVIEIYKNPTIYVEGSVKILAYSGEIAYYRKGLLHSIEGPAFISVDGTEYFFIDGIKYHGELDYWIAVEKYLKDHPEEVYENSSQD